MQHTPNLNLIRPGPTDYVNINDLNENMDILDDAVSEVQEKADQNEQDIQQTQQEVAAHSADLSSQEVGKGAEMIGLPDPDNLFTATSVGGAMQELFTSVSNGKSLVGGAITDVDESVVIPTDPTFQQLADGIGQISTGKKWASGSYRNNGSTFVTASGLEFTPTVVIARASVVLGSYGNYHTPCAFFAKFLGNTYSFYGNMYQDEGKSFSWYSIPFSTTSKLSSGYSYQNEFKIDLKYNGNYMYQWLVFE